MRVSISEYGHLEGLDVEFQPGLNIIVGENGSGKSSLLEAILWGIYGDSRVRMPSAAVEATIDHVTAIRSTADGKGSITLRIGNSEYHAIREAAAALEESGFPTLDVLKATIWSSQGQLGYVSFTPTERRRFLARVLELDEWESSRVRVKAEVGRLAAEATRLQARIESLGERINLGQKEAEGLEPLVALAEEQPEPEPPTRVDPAEVSLLEAQAQRLEAAVSEEPEIRRELEALSVEDDEGLEERISRLRERHMECVREKSTRDSLLARLASIRRNAETLESIPCAGTDFPKSCRFVSDAYLAAQEIPVVEEALRATSVDVETELARVDAQIKELSARSVHIATQRRKAERLREKLVKAEAAREQLAEVRARLEALRATQAASEGQVAAYNAWQASNGKLMVLRRLRERLREEEAELASLKVKLAGVESRAERLGQIEKDFGPKGVPGYLMEVALPELENLANTYLASFNDAYRVRFSMVKVKSTGGVSETLDILVTQGGSERPVEACSGGERVLVDISVRLALRAFIERRGFKLPSLLVLDETLAPLDEGNRGRFVESLLGITDIERIVLISHVADLRELPGHVIEL